MGGRNKGGRKDSHKVERERKNRGTGKEKGWRWWEEERRKEE